VALWFKKYVGQKVPIFLLTLQIFNRILTRQLRIPESGDWSSQYFNFARNFPTNFTFFWTKIFRRRFCWPFSNHKKIWGVSVVPVFPSPDATDTLLSTSGKIIRTAIIVLCAIIIGSSYSFRCRSFFRVLSFIKVKLSVKVELFVLLLCVCAILQRLSPKWLILCWVGC